MPIRYVDREAVLEGHCAIEEVEKLLSFLDQTPSATANLERCQHVHTAVLQALLSYRVALRGEVYDPFLWKWVAPLLRRAEEP